MPRTSTSSHAAADGAPGQGRAAAAGRAAATTRASVKAAPAEQKAAGKARTARPTGASSPVAPPKERAEAKAARTDGKADRVDGKVGKATSTKATASKPASSKPTTSTKATAKVDKAPPRAEKAAKAPVKAPAKAPAKASPKAPARRPAPHAPASRPSAPRPLAASAPPPAPPPAAAPAAAGSYAGDAAFLDQQRQALLDERATYIEQARALRAEAESLVQEMEPGDVQFDDESGEGGTTTVDRERDLALSNQALAAVEEIDAALEKIAQGRYGICEGCGELIPQPRLEALPYARLCIACKSGGLSRR